MAVRRGSAGPSQSKRPFFSLLAVPCIVRLSPLLLSGLAPYPLSDQLQHKGGWPLYPSFRDCAQRWEEAGLTREGSEQGCPTA